MADRITGLEGRMKAVEDTLSGIGKQVDEITTYITGAKKVWGVAAKNWKKALIFGCGVMTSAGVGNPQVQNVLKFISGFFS